MVQKYLDMFNDPAWMGEALRAGSTGLWKIVLVPGKPDMSKMFGNDTMLMLLGLDSHPEPEECYKHWFSRIEPGSVPKVRAVVDTIVTSGLHAEVSYPWNHPKRGRIFIRCGGRLVPTDDGLTHLMGYHQDVTELQTTRQSLMKSLFELEQVSRDSLTGMPVRRVFFDNAEKAMLYSMVNGHDVFFLMLDVDHFKQTNDQHGHRAGDDVLKELGRRFRLTMRDEDISCRYGGEEFVFLLSQTNLQGAMRAAERLRTACSAAPVQSGTFSIPVTVSIGISHVSAQELYGREDMEEIMENAIEAADKALYMAKRNGRNRAFACIKSGPDQHPDFIPCSEARHEPFQSE